MARNVPILIGQNANQPGPPTLLWESEISSVEFSAVNYVSKFPQSSSDDVEPQTFWTDGELGIVSNLSTMLENIKKIVNFLSTIILSIM